MKSLLSPRLGSSKARAGSWLKGHKCEGKPAIRRSGVQGHTPLSLKFQAIEDPISEQPLSKENIPILAVC